METFLNWLVKSSENPEKVSMTIRGLLLTNVGIFLFVANQFFGLQLTEEIIMDAIANFTVAVGLVLSLIGMLRKAYYAFK
ncbi:MAG: hypothetical protein KBB16_02400 [Candidatus Pacebacteria bacterium]|nr:hypothetical protein [Candidatus Paceibacterota bacterium]